MKSIYQYRNFREILKDAYKQEKKNSPSFTYAQFARRTGLRSPNYLKLVIDGSRNLTPTNIQAFAKSLHLAGDELDYFEALVLENQAKSTTEKRYYARRVNALRKMQRSAIGQTIVRERPTALLDNTLKIGILLLAKGNTTEQLAEYASDELGIQKTKVLEILKELIANQELLVDDEGLLTKPHKHIMMNDPKGLNEWQKNFIQTGLHESHSIFLERYPTGNAKFLTLLFSAPQGSLNDLFGDLRQSFEKIMQKYDPLPDQEKGIYRIQFQAYRLRKNNE